MKLQKNIASRILKCGVSKVWIDPKRIADVKEAITARDIRALIKEGVIIGLPKTGLSNFRKKKLATQKKRGRRKGPGSKKGVTQKHSKRLWIKKIRALRSVLREYRANGQLDSEVYKQLYRKSKGGFFRSKAHMKSHIEKMEKLQSVSVSKK